MKSKCVFLIVFFLTITVLIVNSNTSSALSIDNQCTIVETIFARGSGQPLQDREATRFKTEIGNRLKDESVISINNYELGTESYGGYRYPAVSVNNDWLHTNAIGAFVSGGQAFAYGDSVKQGVGELKSYLSQRYAKCKSAGTQYILGGYSQGAQVIGQAMPDIPREIRDQIVFVGMFGDPKLYYPEGEGWNPPACQGKDYSPWRRAASNCKLDNGSLGAHKPYVPDDMKNKTGLWCYAHDEICDAGAFPETSGHETYKNPGLAIDQAAREAVSKLAKNLPNDTASQIDTSIAKGSGTTGIDTVFIIDTTGSMSNIIEQTKTFAKDSADKIKAQNGRVALVVYKDAGDVYTAQIMSQFDDDYATFLSQLGSLTASGGGDTPEAGLHALMTAFDGLSWKNGATKAAVVLTDAPFHDPDIVDGSTAATVAKRSLEIDPINVYPIVPSGQESFWQNLAALTSGQVITSNGDTVTALTTALTKIQNRPVAQLKNTDYSAAPGQEITFDASDSYVVDANITAYDWDFDGDGTFDATTTIPIINHTYPADFTGTMQVRVTADNGTIASASASVTISSTPAPTLPSTPQDLTATVTSTTDTTSTVHVSWSAEPDTNGWVVTLNDMPIGTITDPSQTSLDITDVERTDDVTIGLAGVNEAGTGDFSTATIPSLTASSPSPSPSPSPSTSPSPTPTPDTKPSGPDYSVCSNLFILVKIACQAAMLALYLIQSVVKLVVALII